MTRKMLSALTALCLAALCVIASAAAGLPFAKVPSAPQDMRFVFSYPNEGSECIQAVYTVPDELCRVAALPIEGQEKYYGSNFDVCVQFDWAVDDKTAFHYDERWDTAVNGLYPIQQIGGSCVQCTDVFWFTDDEAVQRCAPGVTDKGGAKVFDFENHALYVRARFFVYDYRAEKAVFSDWTETLDVGKSRDAQPEKVPDAGKARLMLSKGEIDDAEPGRVTFELRLPDALRQTALVLKRDYGVELNLEAMLRADGGKWEYWILPDGLYPYIVGRRSFTVDPAQLDGKIEFRCRLTGGNPDYGTAVTTGWSDILTVEGGKVSMQVNDDPFGEKEAEAERLAAEKEANKCKVCGICPHPLGLCLFIWLGIALVIAAIAVYNVIAHKKKVKKQAEIKAREAASRSGSAVDTGSFINTDRISLNKTDDAKETETQEGEDHAD